MRVEGLGFRVQGSGLRLRDPGLGLPVTSTRNPVYAGGVVRDVTSTRNPVGMLGGSCAMESRSPTNPCCALRKGQGSQSGADFLGSVVVWAARGRLRPGEGMERGKSLVGMQGRWEERGERG